MARYRPYRRRKRFGPQLVLLLAGGVVAATWWFFLRSGLTALTQQPLVVAVQPRLTTDRPDDPSTFAPQSDVSEKGAAPSPSTPEESTNQRRRAAVLVTAGKQALSRGELIPARTYFSEALALGVAEADRSLVRAELTRLGNETIFSPRLFEGDPMVSRYIIKPGETLGKIARAHHISADLLAAINHITNKNMIRAGQAIKVIKGPFRAEVDKSEFILDVYLAETLVTHFRVGLGADGSTPTGMWRVATKLQNPTYYPPRTGHIVAADDPTNPLGERWIGLQGVGGAAIGQLRYGIHGTIEPDSIGQSVSMGCIRLYNEDVEALYTYLVEKHSTVKVHD